jgi:VWFA-related protein
MDSERSQSFCRARRGGAFLLLLLAASLPSFAQERAAGEPLSSFGEVIDVRVVNLEVVVTDREGIRVPGLSRSDFRLLVDGNEIPIEFFTEVREGQAMASTTGEPPGASSVVPSGPVGTSFLVFIDNLFSLRVRRDEVLRAMKTDIARLGPEDRMAVVAYDGRKLVKLCSWIRSPDELTRAIEQAFSQRAHGINEKAELAAMEASQRLVPSGDGRGLSFDQLAYARQLNDRPSGR